MSQTDDNETLQAIEAARQRRWWLLWGYDGETDKLVLHSAGPHRRLWRYDPDAFLVFRSPRYIRLEALAGGFELTTGARAMEVMRHPPPTSVLTEDSQVVLARSDEGECCVVCDSVGFHIARGDAWAGSKLVSVPLAADGGSSLSVERFCRPIDQIAHLGEIQGATLQWRALDVSHTTLVLAATGVPGEPLALRFGYTEYLDCPTTMHNVRIRMATVAEREAVRQRVSKRLADRFDDERWSEMSVAVSPREGLLVLECEEGVFSIWAWVVFLSWRDAGERLFDLWIHDPLWRRGPRLAEL